MQEIPVFIAPGAGDPLFADSLYNEAALRAHGLAPWSENVHIFQSGELQTYTLPGKSSIKISGIGLTKDGRRQTPVIPPLSESDKVAINILLLPLGLADTESGVLDSKLKTYIKSLGYSYTALSGLKNAVTLIGDNDAVAAACAGTFIGQRQQEKGLRQALFGNLDRRIAGGLDITVRPEEFDPRRIVSLNFDVTGKDPSLLKDLLKETMQASGARPLIDMVVLNLEGTYPGAQELDLVSQAKEFDFFQLRIVDNTRPDYLETLSDKNVIESRFASMMNELKEQATAGGADQEKSRQAVIKDALYYGLEAIRQGRVTIRHAD